LEVFNQMPMPDWGPSLAGLDLNQITFFMTPEAMKNARSWDDVPADIKRTFDRLGIPEAERKALAGAGAQYESENVYHNLKKEWEDLGVVFLDTDEALEQYPELIKKYFMTTCVPVKLHKFSALHAAVWSGGTYIYVPENVKVGLPLQAYFRMNAEKMGQFEHTLIIAEKNSQVSYIEGCFTKGATITTNPDYKKIEDIKSNDVVLTHTGQYKKVYHTQVRPYSGNLYSIKIFGDSTPMIEVTEEHPFLAVKRNRKRDRNKTWHTEWLTTDKLKRLDYLALPINKTVKSSDFHEFEIKKGRGGGRFEIIKKKVPLTKEFFRLVGYYLAEGSIMKDSYLSFSFGSHEREYIEDVKRLLKKVFGIKKLNEIVHKKNRGTSIVVGSVELARIFKIFGTSAESKSIPHFMMLENPEKQKELVVGFFRGDGNYYKKRTKNNWLKEVFRINTISEKLAKQTREILFRLKIPAFLNKRDRKKPRKPIYTIGITGEFMRPFGNLVGAKIKDKINNKRRASMFFVDENYIFVPIKSIAKKFVTGVPVYNFSVEGDESYVANGVAVHNCSAPIYVSSSLHAGCVEIHVKENARVRYSSVENWSKNTYNLNTKRAVADRHGIIEWINGNTGSRCTMLYPCSVLKGEYAKSDYIGIAFAGKGQHQDTGHKVYHLAPHTSSTVTAKSISKDGGISSYRGLLRVNKGSIGSKSRVRCDALIVDEKSISNTFPYMKINEKKVDIAHEATVGRISADQLFYLMSRGLTEEQASQMIVSGFIEPVIKELPLEYAVELNRLIQLEMEGSVG